MMLNKILIKQISLFLSFAIVLVLVSCTANIKTGEVKILGETATIHLPAIPGSGSHAILIFTEMHYQPSYKSQEIPRIMPHSEAVPMNGKELTRNTMEYKALQIPVNYDVDNQLTLGNKLYAENCIFCHGSNLDGNGAYRDYVNIKTVEGKVINKGAYPANLLSEKTSNSSDGELFAFISKGSRTGLAQYEQGLEIKSGMLPYDSILTEQERWALVSYLRSVQKE
jgi:mono/diheme cytochrome c family protein